MVPAGGYGGARKSSEDPFRRGGALRGLAVWLFGARDDGVGPDFCGNCRKLALPCSKGHADAKGRRCPQVDHACVTFEGEAVWRAVSRAGGWTGGGMVPRRVDRSAVRARLPDVPLWILEELIDAFEPAALEAAAVVESRRQKPEASTKARARRAPRPNPRSRR